MLNLSRQSGDYFTAEWHGEVIQIRFDERADQLSGPEVRWYDTGEAVGDNEKVYDVLMELHSMTHENKSMSIPVLLAGFCDFISTELLFQSCCIEGVALFQHGTICRYYLQDPEAFCG